MVSYTFAPMSVGNVNDKPLDKIWDEVLASDFLQRLKDPQSRTGHCRGCRYLEDCKGCRSRAFSLTGDWFAADPCCPLSLKLAANKEG